MKFVKGMIIGGMITAGVAMMCAESMEQNKKKMIKKGRQFVKKMGIV